MCYKKLIRICFGPSKVRISTCCVNTFFMVGPDRMKIHHFEFIFVSISSLQFSRSVVSDSSWPHESQHTRPPCPSPTPGVHWDSCPSSQWCHPAISSSVIPFSSCLQCLPASESFPKKHKCLKLNHIKVNQKTINKHFLVLFMYYSKAKQKEVQISIGVDRANTDEEQISARDSA